MPRSARERMARYRTRLRADGLRPVQIWVPDTRAPGFAEEIRRQSLVIAGREAAEADVLDFIESVADTDGWR